MNYPGRIQNGVVVLENGISLPEGAKVVVSCDDHEMDVAKNGAPRVEFPLVPSSRPFTVQFSKNRIGELLDAEDVSA